MRKTVLPISLIFLGLALAGPVRAAGRLDTAAVDTLVRDALKAFHVPGVAVAIVRDGEVVYLEGHGVRDVARRDPVTPDTLFPLASCTKGFTTTALAILADEGKLTWDDPVSKHVPFFHLSDPLADREVRLRDLLCHRTGLREHVFLWYHSPLSQEETIRRAGLLPLDRPFRSTFQYQSTMFTTTGFVVRSAARMPWDEFVQKRLLDPLEMKATLLTSKEVPEREHAVGHQFTPGGQVRTIPAYPLATPDAAGSMHSTARDLAKWVRFQLGDGQAGGRRLVSARNLAEAHRPQTVIPLDGPNRRLHSETVQMSYAFAWVVQDYRGQLLVSHAGAIDGFRAHFTLVPRAGIGIVLLNNLNQTYMNQALSNSLVDLLLDLPRKDWIGHVLTIIHEEKTRRDEVSKDRLAQRHKGTNPTLPLVEYAGKYEHPAYGTVEVKLDSDQLMWTWNRFRGELEHWHFDTFVLHESVLLEPDVVFRLGPDGKVAAMEVQGPVGVEFKRK
jgi:CubicO group peptidase (beta-lactamase class C family)